MPRSHRSLGFLAALVMGTAALAPLGCVAGHAEDGLAVRLQQLEDREAIRALLLSYGRTLDRHDFHAYADLFSEQGEWVNGDTVLKGRTAIFDFMDKAMGHGTPNDPLTYHIMVNNDLIDVDGDHASATTNSIVVRQTPETGLPLFRFMGRYKDTFVRENGRWLFQRREAFTAVPAP